MHNILEIFSIYIYIFYLHFYTNQFYIQHNTRNMQENVEVMFTIKIFIYSKYHFLYWLLNMGNIALYLIKKFKT